MNRERLTQRHIYTYMSLAYLRATSKQKLTNQTTKGQNMVFRLDYFQGTRNDKRSILIQVVLEHKFSILTWRWNLILWCHCNHNELKNCTMKSYVCYLFNLFIFSIIFDKSWKVPGYINSCFIHTLYEIISKIYTIYVFFNTNYTNGLAFISLNRQFLFEKKLPQSSI